MRIPMAVATAALLATSLAACGGDGSGAGSDYCKELKRAKSSISGTVDAADMQWEDSVKSLHALADAAPTSIATEWKTLDADIAEFENGLKDVGLTLSDMDKIFAGETSGIGPGAMAKFKAGFKDSFGSDDFTKAWDAVVKHAKDSCKVEID